LHLPFLLKIISKMASVEDGEIPKELSHLQDWTIVYLIIEVGCRGWIPGRFFPLLRKIGFSGQELRRVHENLQLLARKCSYVIWLNRFNKDFQPFRITVGNDNQNNTLKPSTSAISRDQKDRSAKNLIGARRRLTEKGLSSLLTSTSTLSYAQRLRATKSFFRARSRLQAKTTVVSGVSNVGDTLSNQDVENLLIYLLQTPIKLICHRALVIHF